MDPPSPISTVAVLSAGQWYSWDVTGEAAAAAAQATDSPTLSFVLGLRTSEEDQEEQVVFTSKEAGQNTPRLVVTYSYELVIPWWIWAIAIAAAAVIAFGTGMMVSRRRRPAFAETRGPASPPSNPMPPPPLS